MADPPRTSQMCRKAAVRRRKRTRGRIREEPTEDESEQLPDLVLYSRECGSRLLSSHSTDTRCLVDDRFVSERYKEMLLFPWQLSFFHLIRGIPQRLLIIILITIVLSSSSVSAQNCPNFPSYVQVTHNRQFFQTPGYRNVYPPNIDCSLSLKTADSNHRIQITVHDSELEERLFTECADFISIRDGNSQTSLELARWCGRENPLNVAGHEESMLITFHSDFSIHRKGVNLSFVQYQVPGCPPGWSQPTLQDSTVPMQCYKIIDLTNTEKGNPTWVEAQRFCNFEEASLFVAESESELKAIIQMVAANETMPWIGYNDANNEGTFVALDGKATIPTNPLNVRENTGERDCVVLDTSGGKGEQKTYHVAKDCRDKHPALCKRLTSGEQPVKPPLRETVRKGYVSSSVDYTFWILILAALILLLILLCVICRACKRKQEQQTKVHINDSNMKLVKGVDGDNTHHHAEAVNVSTSFNNSGGARLATDAGSQSRMTTPHPGPLEARETTPPKNLIIVKEKTNHKKPISPVQEKISENDVLRAQQAERAVIATPSPTPGEHLVAHTTITQAVVHNEEPRHTAAVPRTPEPSHEDVGIRPIQEPSRLPQTSKTPLPPLNIRETTYTSINTRDESFLRTKRTGELFERPKMNVLDNVSAISLDEFWNNTK